MFAKKRLTKEQALEKIKQYCAYQERCHKEVKNKLYTFGLYKSEVEEIISYLIEHNFLNEERFAILFAGGKFRMKHWGRKKIQYELQQKGVSSYCIALALKEIEDDQYLTTLRKLALTKWTSVANEPAITRYAKTNAYLLQKGYEPTLISQAIARLKSEGDA